MTRMLQEKLEQPVTGPPSPRDINNGDTAQNLSSHIDHLRGEVNKLKKQLFSAQVERKCRGSCISWVLKNDFLETNFGQL